MVRPKWVILNSKIIPTRITDILSGQGRSLTWLAFTLLVPLTTSGLLTAWALGNESWLHSFGTTEWLLTYLIASLAMGLALVPTTFIALLSGYLLGWAGLPPMVISYLLASVIGFYISRAIDSDRLMVAMSRFPKTAKAIGRLRERQSGLVFFGRISPVLPFAMMNLVLPALGVRFLPFLLVGMIGMLPRTVLMIWLGDQGRDLRAAMVGGEGDFGTIAFTLLLTALSILGLGLIVRRAFKG